LINYLYLWQFLFDSPNSVWLSYTIANCCSTTATIRNGRSLWCCRTRYFSISCFRTSTIMLILPRRKMAQYRRFRTRLKRMASWRKWATGYRMEKGKAIKWVQPRKETMRLQWDGHYYFTWIVLQSLFRYYSRRITTIICFLLRCSNAHKKDKM